MVDVLFLLVDLFVAGRFAGRASLSSSDEDKNLFFILLWKRSARLDLAVESMDGDGVTVLSDLHLLFLSPAAADEDTQFVVFPEEVPETSLLLKVLLKNHVLFLSTLSQL